MPDSPQALLACGHIQLDPVARTLDVGPERYHLTPKENQLLEVLMRHEGQVLTRQYLMKAVWQTDYFADTRTLEVHVHWLREKIESGLRGRLIYTVRSVGYVLRPPRPGEAEGDGPPSAPGQNGGE